MSTQVKGPDLATATTFPSGRSLGVFGGGGVVIPASDGGATTAEGEIIPALSPDGKSAADHGRVASSTARRRRSSRSSGRLWVI